MSHNDLYVTLTPSGVADQERIFGARCVAPKRIKVSAHSHLTVIGQYVLGLVPSSRKKPSRVVFYAGIGADRVSVPPCFTLEELFFITNQGTDGEVYYTFIDDPETESESQPPENTPEPPVFETVFHSGLSLFSNSVGMLRFNLDRRMDSLEGKGDGTGGDMPRSLKNWLEAVLKDQGS
jgi:hypothetical protein